MDVENAPRLWGWHPFRHCAYLEAPLCVECLRCEIRAIVACHPGIDIDSESRSAGADSRTMKAIQNFEVSSTESHMHG